MGLLLGLIVNALLLSIPIGSTLGTLFKLRPFRNDIIQQPKDHNHIIVTSACEEFHEFVQNKIGINYTVNSNEILPETDSILCMTMTTFENNTYPSSSTAPPFSFTWEYPFTTANVSSPANETKPLIHAFPQARIDSSVIPLALEELGQLTLDFTWTMGTGDTIAPNTGLLPLGAKEVNASVGLDMYMDPDQTMAGDAGNASFEMIILFAHFGLQDPVGFGNGTVVMTDTLDGTDFNLFVGRNANSQNVFSWVATQPVGGFHSDITPLFNSIFSLRGTKGLTVDIPTYTDFLGYVGFGTQAYSSIGNVTFWVPRLSIDIQKFGT